jgi:hypothetical protein
MIRFFRPLLFGILLTAAGAGPVLAVEQAPEYVLKAAFIYNFAGFTEWPPGTGNTLNVCIAGKNPFGSALDSLEGKLLGNRRFAIKPLTAGESPRSCQILFIGASEPAETGRLLEEIKGAPVLTITEGNHAADQGVMINLLMDQRKIAFEVNLEAARRARLDISSKLLRLARRVY